MCVYVDRAMSTVRTPLKEYRTLSGRRRDQSSIPRSVVSHLSGLHEVPCKVFLSATLYFVPTTSQATIDKNNLFSIYKTKCMYLR